MEGGEGRGDRSGGPGGLRRGGRGATGSYVRLGQCVVSYTWINGCMCLFMRVCVCVCVCVCVFELPEFRSDDRQRGIVRAGVKSMRERVHMS